jgi:PTH2 family peptidyl-tRNA hydrolase
MGFKQAILVRKDLDLPKGKLGAQVAHAAVECVLRSDKKTVAAWRAEGMPKVVLKVKDLKELHKFNQDAKDMGFVTALITDAGRTVVEPGTVTCLGIGPADEEDLDKLIGELKLL